MKVIVIGPQHSCTRLFTAIIDRHPDVSFVEHWSVPSGTKTYLFPHDVDPHDMKPKEWDRIIVINRDSNAIDMSCERDGIKIHENENENQSQKSKAFIRSAIDNLSEAERSKISFVSFESLADYKELYLRQVFITMGLDPGVYDYNLSGRYIFDPPRWFTVILDIKDSNRKYLSRLWNENGY